MLLIFRKNKQETLQILYSFKELCESCKGNSSSFVDLVDIFLDVLNAQGVGDNFLYWAIINKILFKDGPKECLRKVEIVIRKIEGYQLPDLPKPDDVIIVWGSSGCFKNGTRLVVRWDKHKEAFVPCKGCESLGLRHIIRQEDMDTNYKLLFKGSNVRRCY